MSKEPLEIDMSTERKREVLLNMLEGNKKYSEPFTKGRSVMMSLTGGNWLEYATFMVNAMTLDTLLKIEEKMEGLAKS
jgi:hypothetical protein